MLHRNRSSRFYNRGMGMLDMLGALGVMAFVIAVVVMPTINKGRGQTRSLADVNEIQSATTALLDQYAMSPNFNGIGTSSALKYFSSSHVNGTSITNEFNGFITLASTTISSTDDAMAWSVTNYPADACVTLVSKMAGSMTQITVDNGGGAQTVLAPGGTYDAGVAGSACSGNSNTIELDRTR